MRSPVKMKRWFSLIVLVLFAISAWGRVKREFASNDRHEENRGSSRSEKSNRTKPKRSPIDEGDIYSGLTSIGRGGYESPGGLRYRRGSEDGNRWKHVLRHAVNETNHPGKYGVFSGSNSEILALLDEAYALSQKRDRRVSTRKEGRRTIHDVDLGRTIGYVGGRWGRKRGTPKTSRVRLVLERDNEVITSYPVN